MRFEALHLRRVVSEIHYSSNRTAITHEYLNNREYFNITQALLTLLNCMRYSK